MSVGAADVHKAIVAAWDAADLDSKFTALWDSSVTVSEWPVLHDQQAPPDQPWPYCVMEQSATSVIERMSGTASSLRHTRDTRVTFNVHARQVSGDSRTAKQIAADLAGEIMKVFGGHPTSAPSTMTLDNGNFLISVYDNDFGVRTGDEEYQWVLEYTIRTDVPVAV